MADGDLDTPAAISAIVDPIKAVGGLVGFAIGALATYRSGGAIPDSIMHGILGALLLYPVAWFLALILVREGIRANVDDQRRAYERKVVDAKRQIAQQMQSAGMPLPPALQEYNRAELPPGS
jgi:hypothetical protein